MRYKILDQNGLNFVTFTIVDWIDLFTRSAYCDIVLDSLRFCQKEKQLNIYAYVIMPSHIHLIIDTDNPNGLSPIIKSFKSYTAKSFLQYINNLDNPESRREWLLNRFEFNARKQNSNSHNQIWKRDNHPILLYSPEAIITNLNYIHNNPINAGYVDKAEHYRYSSATNYYGNEGLLNVILIDDVWNNVGYVHTG